MAIAQANPVIRYARHLAASHLTTALADAQLLERYACQGDESAFTALVRRHGPLVLGACRRVLHDGHAADDAFQATFVVLARKANSLRRPAALGPWLYGVATRTALKIRGREVRRRAAERLAAVGTATDSLDSLIWRDLRPVLDEAVASLPDHYRVPFVLHHLEGTTVAEVARRLGCPQGTVCARLARAKEQLRGRLAHKGLVASLSGILTLLSKNVVSAGVPAPLLVSTVQTAAVALGQEMVREVGPATVAALVKGGIQTMFMTKVHAAAAMLFLAGAVGGVGLFGQPSEQSTTSGMQVRVPKGFGEKSLVQDAKPKTPKNRVAVKDNDNDGHHTPIFPPLLPGAGPLPGDPPSMAAILRALPPIARGIPHVYEEFRDDYDVAVERLVDRLDPPRFFPMVGPAQLRHLHYKCTVYFTETIQSSYPFPFQCQRRRSEIIYWDRDQLYLVATSPNPTADKVGNPETQPKVPEVKYIKLQMAEKDFRMAEYYRRTGHFGSARFYYDLVCRRYPKTSFAEKAAASLLEMSVFVVVNGQAIVREEVHAAANLSIPDAHTLTMLERACRLGAMWWPTLDRLVEREVVLQHALGSLLERNPKILAKLQATAAKEFDRKWVEPTKKNAGLKNEEDLQALLREQGTSLEAVGRQWQRDFMLREYRRSRTRDSRATSLEQDREWQRIVTDLKRAAVIEYPEGK